MKELLLNKKSKILEFTESKISSKDITTINKFKKLVIEEGDNGLRKISKILKEKEMYLEKYAFNKWFFGNGSDLDLSYNIDEDTWNKIKLSNINCGRTIFGTGLYPNKVQWPAIKKNKEVDIISSNDIDINIEQNMNFFHLGPKNNWKTQLDTKIVDEINIKFKNEMLELGYLK